MPQVGDTRIFGLRLWVILGGHGRADGDELLQRLTSPESHAGRVEGAQIARYRALGIGRQTVTSLRNSAFYTGLHGLVRHRIK